MHNTRDIAAEEGTQTEKRASRQVLVKLVSEGLGYALLVLPECSPSGKGVFCEPVELPLLRRLLSLLTDKLDLSFLCILCETGVDGCFLGCSVVGDVVGLAPGPDPPLAVAPMLAPQEHVRVAPAPTAPGWIPLPLLSWSLSPSPSAGCGGTGWESDWGWAGQRQGEKRISLSENVQSRVGWVAAAQKSVI